EGGKSWNGEDDSFRYDREDEHQNNNRAELEASSRRGVLSKAFDVYAARHSLAWKRTAEAIEV
ncbi:MAG: hypothetical protein DIU80_016605, partial [Chloroflexota bacterium]